MITLSLAQANEYAPNSLDATVGQIVLDGVIREIHDRFGDEDTAPLRALGLKLYALEIGYMADNEGDDETYFNAKMALFKDAGYIAPVRIVGDVSAATPTPTPSPISVAGRGAAVFAGSAAFNAVTNTIEVDITVYPGVPQRFDFIYFIIPPAISTGDQNAYLRMSVGATVGDLLDISGDRILPPFIRPNDLVGVFWDHSNNFRFVEPLAIRDAVLLASGAAVPDRSPATDPDATTFQRYVGLSGYNPVTQADINDAQRNINSLADWRGGNTGTLTNAPANTLPNQQFGNDLEAFLGLNFGAAVPIYLWFGFDATQAVGLTIHSVTYDGSNIPVTKQAGQVDIAGNTIDVWVADHTRTWSEIKDHPFELELRTVPGFPATWNRYAAVSQNPVPDGATFAAAGVRTSATPRVFIPTGSSAGWRDGFGYLHFALPADQDEPTIIGQPGSFNLLDDFNVRSANPPFTVNINGDAMRTVSSRDMVFEMTDRFSLFPWIIR